MRSTIGNGVLKALTATITVVAAAVATEKAGGLVGKTLDAWDLELNPPKKKHWWSRK